MKRSISILLNCTRQLHSGEASCCTSQPLHWHFTTTPLPLHYHYTTTPLALRNRSPLHFGVEGLLFSFTTASPIHWHCVTIHHFTLGLKASCGDTGTTQCLTVLHHGQTSTASLAVRNILPLHFGVEGLLWQFWHDPPFWCHTFTTSLARHHFTGT